MEAEEPCSIPLSFIPLPISVRFAFAAVVLTSPAAFRQIFAAREDFDVLHCRELAFCGATFSPLPPVQPAAKNSTLTR
jgi:hypothetical protein